MSPETNKALVHHVIQTLSEGNLAILDKHPGLEEVRSTIMRSVADHQAAGVGMRVEEVIAEGEWVVVRMIGLDGPDRREVEIISMYKVVDGAIVKQYAHAGPL